jgi:uncharacterized protein YuzE
MSLLEKVATAVFQAIKPDSHVVIDYDQEEDVLYINYTNSPLQPADFGRRFGDYIIRIRESLVIGVTILNAHIHFANRFSDKPSILKEPLTIKIVTA